MTKFSLLSISSLAVMALSFWLTIWIVEDLNQYKTIKEQVVDVLGYQNRLLSSEEWLSSTVAVDKMNNANVLLASANELYRQAVHTSLFLFGAVLVFLGLNTIFYFQSVLKHRAIGISFIVASLCFIYLGLQTPFLEIEAFNSNLSFALDLGFFGEYDFDFKGDIYYLYQNKSVFEVIGLLFSGGSILVGIALVLFSIVFPLFKLLMSLAVLISPESHFADRYVGIINRIGKWSMADVFVAAIFLAFFAFSNMSVGVETRSNTLIGLYYFMCFVLLSISSSYFLKQVG